VFARRHERVAADVRGQPTRGRGRRPLRLIAMLNFQGERVLAAGVFVLLMLAPSRAPGGDRASATTF